MPPFLRYGDRRGGERSSARFLSSIIRVECAGDGIERAAKTSMEIEKKEPVLYEKAPPCSSCRGAFFMVYLLCLRIYEGKILPIFTNNQSLAK